MSLRTVEATPAHIPARTRRSTHYVRPNRLAGSRDRHLAGARVRRDVRSVMCARAGFRSPAAVRAIRRSGAPLCGWPSEQIADSGVPGRGRWVACGVLRAPGSCCARNGPIPRGSSGLGPRVLGHRRLQGCTHSGRYAQTLGQTGKRDRHRYAWRHVTCRVSTLCAASRRGLTPECDVQSLNLPSRGQDPPSSPSPTGSAGWSGSTL
jgi:hypothetical protein